MACALLLCVGNASSESTLARTGHEPATSCMPSESSTTTPSWPVVRFNTLISSNN